MKVIITARVVLTPQDDMEQMIRNAGTEAREAWIVKGEETLRQDLAAAYEGGEIEVKIIIKDDDQPPKPQGEVCGTCDGTGRVARYGRKEEGEPQIVRGDCPRCTREPKLVCCAKPNPQTFGPNEYLAGPSTICTNCGWRYDQEGEPKRWTHEHDELDPDCSCPGCHGLRPTAFG